MKKIDTIDATPPKDIFRSIIADYNLNLGISELVDNAIDLWTKSNTTKKLRIEIIINSEQQKIKVIDNAGGIKPNDIVLFVSPGRSGNTGNEEIIGIFGVGSKRALVALAEDIKMSTRYENGKTNFISFNEAWLADDSWNLEVFEHHDEIDAGTTIIELLGLRFHLDTLKTEQLREHLSTVYARFIKTKNIEIKLNGEAIDYILFDENWAYPPGYQPTRYKHNLLIEGQIVRTEIIGGLISSTGLGEYGVYFYCNDRLIDSAMKDYEVGFTAGKAGAPHPSLGLMRVIVDLKGEARFMPWNSSKSAVNTKHKVFEQIRDHLIGLVTYYAGLSRRLQGDWPDSVFKFKDGEIIEKEIADISEIENIYSIPLPKVRHKYEDIIKQNNKELARKEPWITGIYEGIVMARIILKQRLTEKNRFALLVIDSNMEIAFKEYLVRKSGERYGEDRLKALFKDRSQVQNEI